MRYHKDSVWLLDPEPITCPSAPFSVPFNTRAPGLYLGKQDGVLDQNKQLFTQVFLHVPESTLARIETNDLVQLGEKVSQAGLCTGHTSGSGQDRETMVGFSTAPKSWNQTNPIAPSEAQINTYLQHFTRNTSMPCFILMSSFRINFSTSSVCGWKSSFSISNIHIHTFLPPFVPFILILSFAASGSQRHPSITACLTRRQFTASQLLACGQMCWSNT